MKLRNEKKVVGGKLLKCTINIINKKIKDIKLTGDFFLHPEESIESLEEKLRGCSADEKSVTKIINTFFNNTHIKLIGASPSDFIDLIVKLL